METHIEFDEDYHFASQLVSCASSSGSFSTASSCSGPHTPISGRSTPQRRTLSMEHDPLTSPPRLGYEIATPNSSLSSYFPPDIKNDFHPLAEYDLSATPCRKSSIPAQAMEFDYAQMFNTLPPQSQTMEAVHSQALGNLNYTHHILASPFAPAPHMGSNAPDCDASSVWCHPHLDESMEYFASLDRNEPTSMLSMRSPSINDKRRVHVDESQHKSTALHQAQCLQRAHLKRAKKEKPQIFPPVIKSGTHKCPYPQCKNRNAFKRSEHLKRHIYTHHNPTFTQCPFCDKKFNRKDNWVQHLKLHIKPHNEKDRAVKRTEYHPGAQALYDEERRKNKSRSQINRRKTIKTEQDE